MKLRPFNRFNRNDYRGAPDWFFTFLDSVNFLPDTLNRLLFNQISLDDNLLAERQTVSVTHGVPVTVRLGKLKQTPFLVRAGYAEGAEVASANITSINSDGTIGVVVRFVTPPPAAVSVVLVFEP